MVTPRSRGMDRYVSRCLPGSVRSSIIESEWSSELRPACPLFAWSVPSRRMFDGELRMSPFCFVNAVVVPGASRWFASATPLRTDRYPAAAQMTNRTTRTTSVSTVHRFHVHGFRCRRAPG